MTCGNRHYVWITVRMFECFIEGTQPHWQMDIKKREKCRIEKNYTREHNVIQISRFKNRFSRVLFLNSQAQILKRVVICLRVVKNFKNEQIE